MGHTNQSQLDYMKSIRDRGRGRPRSASVEQQERNYRDESGQYQLVEGLQPWHYRLSDYFLMTPHAKYVDAAKAFGVSPSWISEVMSSDAFKEFHDARMAQHRASLEEGVKNKMLDVADKSLGKMSDLLQGSVDMDDATKAASLALKGLGFGQTGPRVSVTQNTMVAVAPASLAKARELMLSQMKATPKDDKGIEHYEHVTASLTLENNEHIEEAMIIDDDAE